MPFCVLPRRARRGIREAAGERKQPFRTIPTSKQPGTDPARNKSPTHRQNVLQLNTLQRTRPSYTTEGFLNHICCCPIWIWGTEMAQLPGNAVAGGSEDQARSTLVLIDQTGPRPEFEFCGWANLPSSKPVPVGSVTSMCASLKDAGRMGAMVSVARRILARQNAFHEFAICPFA